VAETFTVANRVGFSVNHKHRIVNRAISAIKVAFTRAVVT